ncbi:MATH and LRR domain-containing protein PFE0570w-like [Condylostylus longicornis]|uniref:MATH and LRR domain-containing protein PFE0570w-like n=1 Tax=Condylostylus longicornis TaxID=2530218 RepID=UPI00244E2EF8|nr:MATH and LRR domain-containing protein PFE0570w-like [Condylostylus longicornis]
MEEDKDYITVVEVDDPNGKKLSQERVILPNEHNDLDEDSSFITVLSINENESKLNQENKKQLTVISEIVVVYRLPGERLGFGLKFQGGTKSNEKIQRLFIQSCAPDSPASRVKASWGNLKEGDEILTIDDQPVIQMTRIECVKCLKESNVAIKLELRNGDGIKIENIEEEKAKLNQQPPPPPPVPPRKLLKRRLSDKIITKKDEKCVTPPPDPEYYINLLSDETASVITGSESDDTSSSISTVIDKFSLSSSYSSESDLTNYGLLNGSNNVINKSELAKVLQPFTLLEEEFNVDSSAQLEECLKKLEPIEINQTIILANEVQVTQNENARPYENVEISLNNNTSKQNLFKNQYENIDLSKNKSCQVNPYENIDLISTAKVEGTKTNDYENIEIPSTNTSDLQIIQYENIEISIPPTPKPRIIEPKRRQILPVPRKINLPTKIEINQSSNTEVKLKSSPESQPKSNSSANSHSSKSDLITKIPKAITSMFSSSSSQNSKNIERAKTDIDLRTKAKSTSPSGELSSLQRQCQNFIKNEVQNSLEKISVRCLKSCDDLERIGKSKIPVILPLRKLSIEDASDLNYVENKPPVIKTSLTKQKSESDLKLALQRTRSGENIKISNLPTFKPANQLNGNEKPILQRSLSADTKQIPERSTQIPKLSQETVAKLRGPKPKPPERVQSLQKSTGIPKLLSSPAEEFKTFKPNVEKPSLMKNDLGQMKQVHNKDIKFKIQTYEGNSIEQDPPLLNDLNRNHSAINSTTTNKLTNKVVCPLPEALGKDKNKEIEINSISLPEDNKYNNQNIENNVEIKEIKKFSVDIFKNIENLDINENLDQIEQPDLNIPVVVVGKCKKIDATNEDNYIVSSSSEDEDDEKNYDIEEGEKLGPPELINGPGPSEAYFNSFPWLSSMLPTIGEVEEEFSSLELQQQLGKQKEFQLQQQQLQSPYQKQQQCNNVQNHEHVENQQTNLGMNQQPHLQIEKSSQEDKEFKQSEEAIQHSETSSVMTRPFVLINDIPESKPKSQQEQNQENEKPKEENLPHEQHSEQENIVFSENNLSNNGESEANFQQEDNQISLDLQNSQQSKKKNLSHNKTLAPAPPLPVSKIMKTSQTNIISLQQSQVDNKPINSEIEILINSVKTSDKNCNGITESNKILDKNPIENEILGNSNINLDLNSNLNYGNNDHKTENISFIQINDDDNVAGIENSGEITVTQEQNINVQHIPIKSSKDDEQVIENIDNKVSKTKSDIPVTETTLEILPTTSLTECTTPDIKSSNIVVNDIKNEDKITSTANNIQTDDVNIAKSSNSTSVQIEKPKTPDKCEVNNRSEKRGILVSIIKKSLFGRGSDKMDKDNKKNGKNSKKSTGTDSISKTAENNSNQAEMKSEKICENNINLEQNANQIENNNNGQMILTAISENNFEKIVTPSDVQISNVLKYETSDENNTKSDDIKKFISEEKQLILSSSENQNTGENNAFSDTDIKNVKNIKVSDKKSKTIDELNSKSHEEKRIIEETLLQVSKITPDPPSMFEEIKIAIVENVTSEDETILDAKLVPVKVQTKNISSDDKNMVNLKSFKKDSEIKPQEEPVLTNIVRVENSTEIELPNIKLICSEFVKQEAQNSNKSNEIKRFSKNLQTKETTNQEEDKIKVIKKVAPPPPVRTNKIPSSNVSKNEVDTSKVSKKEIINLDSDKMKSETINGKLELITSKVEEQTYKLPKSNSVETLKEEINEKPLVNGRRFSEGQDNIDKILERDAFYWKLFNKNRSEPSGKEDEIENKKIDENNLSNKKQVIENIDIKINKIEPKISEEKPSLDQRIILGDEDSNSKNNLKIKNKLHSSNEKSKGMKSTKAVASSDSYENYNSDVVVNNAKNTDTEQKLFSKVDCNETEVNDLKSLADLDDPLIEIPAESIWNVKQDKSDENIENPEIKMEISVETEILMKENSNKGKKKHFFVLLIWE